ncbi:hypothetical protein PIB30_050783 [Stylosanthes scabra]|uniref:Homing endonuclease LAGLIDADG domain-containing protein n=1 Tax=Stylosanthes scabra TaxID=79078 RepID=A0ABU6YF59_9FABA|nr:hypothetical protein [Stylosanthes scabra]
MGLGAFAHLPTFNINHKLLIELVRCYDVFDNTIYTSVGDFRITSEKEMPFLRKGYKILKKISMKKKRAFGLFIQKSFLYPTSTANISPKQLPVIQDIENTQHRNWAHHVNNFLVNGIEEFKEKNFLAVKGCHFVLMIIYFKERYFGKSINHPKMPPPWIRYWIGENLKQKMRLEATDATIS